MRHLPSRCAVRRDHFGSCCGQRGVERVAVVALMGHQAVGERSNEPTREDRPNKLDFGRRISRHQDGERKTGSVCHDYNLAAFAPVSRPDRRVTFFEEARLDQR